MSILPQLLPIEISYDKQRNIIIQNTVKMLYERGLITEQNKNNYISNSSRMVKDNDTFNIKIDHVAPNDSDSYKIILLLEQKITTITKSSIIGEFIRKNVNEHKIFIVNDISSRSLQTLYEDFQNVEVFLKKNMMLNLIEHVLVPKHILLSDKEAKQFIEEYKLQNKNLPYILSSDPVAKYYNAKIGQVFRILRPSETSGFTHFYRIVVKGQITSK